MTEAFLPVPITEIVLPETVEKVTIYPFGDLQVGDPTMDYDKAKAFLEAVYRDESGYLMLGGDLANIAIVGSKSDIYSDTTIPEGALGILVDLLMPLAQAGRILALIDGNHEDRIWRAVGLSFTAVLAAKLGIPDRYHRQAVYLKIAFGKRKDNGKRQVYTVQMLHGAGGGGGKSGAMVNKLEGYVSHVYADLTIFYHFHDPMNKHAPPLFFPDLRNNRLTEYKPKYMVATGWLQYLGSYGQVKLMSPKTIAPNKATLYADEKVIEICDTVRF